MGTSWSEVIANYAMPVIDDVRLTDQMQENPALFLRRMSLYLDLAIPMLSRPKELWVLVDKATKPEYDDTSWVSTDESTTQETVVDTGFTGYELFSCAIREVDESGVVTATPYTATYDPDTGMVTFPIQEKAGVEYVMDFYTDGEFRYDLTNAQKRLLGMAVGVMWDQRFARNWLSITMKIKDSSFETVNESNYMREAQARLQNNINLFNDELRRYEQDLAYQNTLPSRYGLKYI